MTETIDWEQEKLLRIVVIGGGMGGAELVRNAATKGGLDMVLIEPKDRIECQALYPDYLAGDVSIEGMTAPLKSFCDRMGATWIKDYAIDLDLARKVVVCSAQEVKYDILVIAIGAVQNYYGLKGAEKTFSINTLEDAIEAKYYFEKERPKNVAIIGSGPTGIETACALAETPDCKIHIVEMKDRPLPTFARTASNMMKTVLKKKGVRVLTSKRVDEVANGQLIFSEGNPLECEMIIWTAGIKPPAFVNKLDFPKKYGWILTDPYLRVEGREDVFAIGDNAWIEVGENLATKTGMEAEYQAKHTARNLARMARGEELRPYSVKASTGSPAALISTGCRCAVGVYGNLCIHIPAKLIYTLKSWIDKSFVNRFK